MTLASPRMWIQRAQQEGFALGAFNANQLEQAQAVVMAAELENAPAILQVSHRALQYIGGGNTTLGLRYIAEIGKIAAQSVSVPVALHMDHADEQEVIQALALGFTSVMFDGGDLPLDENIATTRRLAEIAHDLGALLEAEVGHVPKADPTGRFDPASELTAPEDAAAFVAATDIDALAIAIGSVHSVHSKEVALDLERLRAIRAVVDAPLVLHGSSGVRDDHLVQAFGLGICKVNVATQLSRAFTEAVRRTLAEQPSVVDPRIYLGPARLAMVEAVRERMRFFGVSGKAGVGTPNHQTA